MSNKSSDNACTPWGREGLAVGLFLLRVLDVYQTSRSVWPSLFATEKVIIFLRVTILESQERLSFDNFTPQISKSLLPQETPTVGGSRVLEGSLDPGPSDGRYMTFESPNVGFFGSRFHSPSQKGHKFLPFSVSDFIFTHGRVNMGTFPPSVSWKVMESL